MKILLNYAIINSYKTVGENNVIGSKQNLASSSN